MIQNRVNSKE
uniref:Uncharacterized protein n=1 Tax=Anguilla anguilla TaxID=7936 RepID=A0A0E9SY90_ANGAN